MTLDPDAIVVACLVALAVVGFVDGVLVHLLRERLHRRPETRTEHLIHTGRAILFVPILGCFFAGASPGIGIAVLALDQVLELADMAIERCSRAYSGGLRSSEYLLHGGALTLRGAAIAASLVAGPPSPAVATLVSVLLPGAIAAATLHLVLMVPRRPTS